MRLSRKYTLPTKLKLLHDCETTTQVPFDHIYSIKAVRKTTSLGMLTFFSLPAVYGVGSFCKARTLRWIKTV